MKALIVDNQPLILRYMEMILKEKDIEPRTAGDGITALEILEEWTPDIIYVDLVMPNIDGERLCRIIRTDRKFDDTTIVILSAISAETEVDFLSFGANACIAKGPLNHMKQHVLALHDLIDRGELEKLGSEVLGLEGVHKRGITEELLSSRCHFELILANASEGIVEVNPRHLVVYANPVAAAFFGQTEENILGKNFFTLFNGSDRTLVRKHAAGVGEGGTVTIDQDITLGDRLIETKLIHVNGEDGTSLAMLKDVTRERTDAAAIQKSLDEKEILLKEIHHRVKNNLAMVSSLINLQGSYVSISDGVYLLDQLKNRIRSISVVHDMLYKSDDLSKVRMKRYIREICTHLLSSSQNPNKKISLSLHIDVGSVTIDIAIPVGLIVTELVTNAAKHAFPGDEDGTITITLHPTGDPGWYELNVEDDGVGIDQDIEVANSLGLKLVSALADQLRGSVESHSSSSGYSVRVRFFYGG